MDLWQALVDPRFMPHGHCYWWEPAMVWSQVSTNLVIGLSYLSISATLWMLTRRMKGIPFSKAYLAFGLFIVSCGITHFIDIVTIWRGVYWLDVSLRAFTALASAATAIWLFPLFPRVVSLGALFQAEREQSRAALQEELARSEALRRKLEASEHQFREVVENLPDLAWSAAADGAIDFYNQRWYEYTGTTSDDMLGWGWKSVHDAAHIEAVEAQWRASITSGVPFEMEFPLRAADGSFRWFLTRVRPLRGPTGDVLRWIGTNTDIHEQRQIRGELKRAVEQRDLFLSIAAHELRTPIMTMGIQLELAEQAITDAPPVRKRVSTALTQLERLQTLVEELLDVTRMGTDGLTIAKVPVDLVEIARAVLDRKEGRAQRSGTELRLRGDAQLVVQGDGSRLDRVLTNLVNNAIKYGNGTPVTVEVSRAADHAEITVTDHGIGIAAADQARIFDKFERAVSADNFGGFGLGLYIVREIVLAHGGSVGVTSEPSAGTTFRVRLPL